MANRRRSERYRIALPVLVKDARGGERALTADISAHGLAVLSPKPRPLRQYLELEILLPHGPAVQVTATVARHADVLDTSGGDTGAGMGLDFFLFDPHAKTEWQAFLKRLRTEGVSSVLPDSVKLERPEADDAGTPTFIIKPRDLGRLWAFYRGEMSKGRVRIETPVLKPTGSIVELLVVHPSSESEWILEGRVENAIPHTRGGRPVIDIALLALDAEIKAEFRNFIATGRGMIEEEISVEFNASEPPPPMVLPPSVTKRHEDEISIELSPRAVSEVSESIDEQPTPHTPQAIPEGAGVQPFASFFAEAKAALTEPPRSATPDISDLALQAPAPSRSRSNPPPPPPRTRFQLSRSDGADPHLEEDIALARERVERMPLSVTACYRLGTLLMQRQDEGAHDEAVSTLKRAIDLEPNHPGAHHSFAEIAAREGNYRLAAEHLARARRLGYEVDPDLARLVSEGLKRDPST